MALTITWYANQSTLKLNYNHISQQECFLKKSSTLFGKALSKFFWNRISKTFKLYSISSPLLDDPKSLSDINGWGVSFSVRALKASLIWP